MTYGRPFKKRKGHFWRSERQVVSAERKILDRWISTPYGDCRAPQAPWSLMENIGRLGANDATEISFSKNIEFTGKTL